MNKSHPGVQATVMHDLMGLAMKSLMLILLLSVFGSLSPVQALEWQGRIERVRDHAQISMPELVQSLSGSPMIILGEKHDTAAIQLAQASVIESMVSTLNIQDFTTAWEFLNYTTQDQTRDAFLRFVSGSLTASELLVITEGNAKLMNYAPILQVTKKWGGQLLGVNLPRSDKDPVVQGGLSAAYPNTVPPGFEMGSGAYFERFSGAMQGHATPDQVSNYFAAQCLTDDVMAYHFLRDSQSSVRFLVLGGFHSDYFDGTVARIQKRAPEKGVAVVRFIDASDFSEAELLSLSVDPVYGDIADFVLFVNEPHP